MLHLVIDSSTKYLYTAIYQDDKLLKELYQTNFRDHSSFILKFINDLFTSLNLDYRELSDITVGEGPGSYTGLRIAGTCAKTISYLLNKPLYTISSLYLLSSGYNEKRLISYDARNNRAFVLAVDSNDNIILNDQLVEDLTKLKKDYPLLIELNQIEIEKIIKIDFKKVLNKRRLTNTINYIPNYCLKTKAEQDYDKNNKK